MPVSEFLASKVFQQIDFAGALFWRYHSSRSSFQYFNYRKKKIYLLRNALLGREARKKSCILQCSVFNCGFAAVKFLCSSVSLGFLNFLLEKCIFLDTQCINGSCNHHEHSGYDSSVLIRVISSFRWDK